MAYEPVSDIDDNQRDRVQEAKKAQEAMGQSDQQTPDVSLATTLALLGPALQSLSKIEHHKHGRSVELDVQTPAALFASSKSSQLGSSNPETPVTNGNTGETGANQLIQGIGSSPNPSGSGSSDFPQTPGDWQSELQDMVAKLKTMPAGEAITYITEKLLPFMGSYKQWEMSGEGVTMKAITKLNSDWNKLKSIYNECAPVLQPDGKTYKDGQPTKEETTEIAALITDMGNTINGDDSLKKALGDSTGIFGNAIDGITGGMWSGKTINGPDIVKYWQQDWDKRKTSSGSGAGPSVTPDSAVLTNFTQLTTQLNNTSAGAQGAFKQDNSDYNTFNQVLTQTLKDLTSQYNYFNQKMTGG